MTIAGLKNYTNTYSAQNRALIILYKIHKRQTTQHLARNSKPMTLFFYVFYRTNYVHSNQTQLISKPNGNFLYEFKRNVLQAKCVLLPPPRGQATTIFLNLPEGQVAIKINLPKITLTCPNDKLFHIVHY